MVEDESKYSIAFLKRFLINDYYMRKKTTDDDINAEIVKILQSNEDDLVEFGYVKFKVFETICQAILGKEMVTSLQKGDAILKSTDFREQDFNMEFYIEIVYLYATEVLEFINKYSTHSDSSKKKEAKDEDTITDEKAIKRVVASKGEVKNTREDAEVSIQFFKKFHIHEFDNYQEMVGRILFQTFESRKEEDGMLLDALKELILELSVNPSHYLRIFGYLIIFEDVEELKRRIFLKNITTEVRSFYISKLKISEGLDLLFYLDLIAVIKNHPREDDFWLDSCNDEEEKEMRIAMENDADEKRKLEKIKEEKKEKKRLEDEQKEKKMKEKKEQDSQDVNKMAEVQNQQKLQSKDNLKAAIFPMFNIANYENKEDKDTNKSQSNEDNRISNIETPCQQIQMTEQNRDLYIMIQELQKKIAALEQELKNTNSNLENTNSNLENTNSNLENTNNNLENTNNNMQNNKAEINQKIEDLTDKLNKICIRGVLVNFARYLEFASEAMNKEMNKRCWIFIDFLYKLKREFNPLAHTVPERLEEVITKNIKTALEKEKTLEKYDLIPFYEIFKPLFNNQLFHDFVIKDQVENILKRKEYYQIASSSLVSF